MAGFYSGSIQKGSKGDETKKWQEFLNAQGYGLSVDGDFGDNTYKATIDYQKKNGLTADGIVGELTWGSAGYSNINTPISAPKSTPFEYADYTESDSVKQAETNKNNAENAYKNYGDFSYSNDDTFKAIMDKILNRENFSYDLNGDAFYQQYKDKYTKQGKMAMQDTMGQAAAMTGGYGNSYAATAGNQAYQASLENLNDIVPELYQMAYDRYNQEGQDLLNQYGMLSDDRNREYGEWSDGYNRAIADRDYYANAYDSERNYDYSKYSNDKSFAYNDHRNEIADAQWNANFNEGKRQYELNLAESKRQFDVQTGLSNSSGGSSSGGGSSGGSGSGGSGSSGGSGNGSGSGTGSGNTTTGSVPKGVIDGLNGKKTNNQKADYLAGLVNDGVITTEQAKELLANNANTQKDLKDRTWTVVSKGGGNLWGVDNNAKVKDQYGNTYRLDDLVKKLEGEGMTNKQAKNWVKKLQQNLGISSNWMFGW